MNRLEYEIEQFLRRLELSEGTKRIVWVIVILLISLLLARIFRHFFIPVLQKISKRTKIQWDDHLFEDDIMHKATRLIPPVVWYLLLPFANIGVLGNNVNKFVYTNYFVLFVNIVNERNGI